MKITKFNHSCLLIEENEVTILIDPGTYTESVKNILFSSLKMLDYILITHKHPDHMSISLIKDLKNLFPDVEIITNKSVAAILEKEAINAQTQGIPVISLVTIAHEKLWFGDPPENTIFTLFSRLTHPGDSLHFTQSTDILALPITAPWGSTVEAVNLGLALKPKVIIPIHDALWKDEVRKSFYPRLRDFFAEHNIIFKGIENGESLEA